MVSSKRFRKAFFHFQNSIFGRLPHKICDDLFLFLFARCTFSLCKWLKSYLIHMLQIWKILKVFRQICCFMFLSDRECFSFFIVMINQVDYDKVTSTDLAIIKGFVKKLHNWHLTNLNCDQVKFSLCKTISVSDWEHVFDPFPNSSSSDGFFLSRILKLLFNSFPLCQFVHLDLHRWGFASNHSMLRSQLQISQTCFNFWSSSFSFSNIVLPIGINLVLLSLRQLQNLPPWVHAALR